MLVCVNSSLWNAQSSGSVTNSEVRFDRNMGSNVAFDLSIRRGIFGGFYSYICSPIVNSIAGNVVQSALGEDVCKVG